MIRQTKTFSIVLSMIALAGTVACGTVKTTDKESTRSTAEVQQKDDKSKGGLSLRMPKKKHEEEQISKLIVTLERRESCWDDRPYSSGQDDGGGILEQDVSVDYEEGAPVGYKDAEAGDEKKFDLRSVEAGGGERCEEALTMPEPYPYEQEEPSYDCGSEYTSYEFDFEEDKIVGIEGLSEGKYYVTVQLLAPDTGLIEEGYSWAYVAAGTANMVEVVLSRISAGYGSLDISIVRGGEEPVGVDDGSEPVEHDVDD